MATILLVSKPVEPPGNDSSKNLVRDLGRQARQAALAEFDRTRMARAYEAVYDALARH